MSLILLKQPAEPPGDIHISDISPSHLTIRWSPASVTNFCPPATYDIATDCGMCPNTTSESDTFIRCTNLIIDERICSIVIRTKTCRRGSHEHSVTANLTVVLSGKFSNEIVISVLFTIRTCSSRCSRSNSYMDISVYFNPYQLQ